MAYKQSNNPLSRKSSPINFHEPKDAEYADRVSHGTGETRREINAKKQKRAKKGVKKGVKAPSRRSSSPLNDTIKKENQGKFTAWSKDHGYGSVAAAANAVMSNKDDYSTGVVKMANFAKNAQSW